MFLVQDFYNQPNEIINKVFLNLLMGHFDLLQIN
jgi:hypothetical protein